MKKTTAGLTFTAITGFGLLTAGPALADGPGGGDHRPPPTAPYVNCDEAAAEGVYNIPADHPRYGPHLDNDGDGIGCEDSTKPMAQVPMKQGHLDADGTWMDAQVGQMPAGGANTGITQEPEESNAGILALSGGLVLAAAAGGTYVVRRRRTAD
ncbi:excalibur calcium-binding domain-containing protein [Arthrobacter sp. zg-Y20]|uniref:excalibur calcium-binding domain-containing protein n=1 Tax=unclassified Arthrobacter TaxID=235627 RepID=UPI001D139305|nr:MULTISPECIES: excalibur calcium-binding domain-containing protein [unclassified Arthrobacter]MCC3275708.1 excalibur calcium-binding domain-containing protein [Arthrobacter sp. zg-Y20]MDK1315865.1 excalibur calcium-binding domain-containing protein [Arthrobacter sp. zg.Y20]WIB06350.1 excalibur calcium-binding domain-containing protein [Arthrobacter sp. zg-Y20]